LEDEEREGKPSDCVVEEAASVVVVAYRSRADDAKGSSFFPFLCFFFINCLTVFLINFWVKFVFNFWLFLGSICGLSFWLYFLEYLGPHAQEMRVVMVDSD